MSSFLLSFRLRVYICYRLCVVQITNCKYISSQMVFASKIYKTRMKMEKAHAVNQQTGALHSKCRVYLSDCTCVRIGERKQKNLCKSIQHFFSLVLSFARYYPLNSFAFVLFQSLICVQRTPSDGEGWQSISIIILEANV